MPLPCMKDMQSHLPRQIQDLLDLWDDISNTCENFFGSALNSAEAVRVYEILLDVYDYESCSFDLEREFVWSRRIETVRFPHLDLGRSAQRSTRVLEPWEMRSTRINEDSES